MVTTASDSPVVGVDPTERAAIERFAQALEHLDDANASSVSLSLLDGQHVDVPREIVAMLKQAALELRRGRAVTVRSLSRTLTPPQAADLFGISRFFFRELLDRNEIPSHGEGDQRRVALSDVLAYQERRSIERRAALAELTRQTEEWGLYDNEPSIDVQR